MTTLLDRTCGEPAAPSPSPVMSLLGAGVPLTLVLDLLSAAPPGPDTLHAEC